MADIDFNALLAQIDAQIEHSNNVLNEGIFDGIIKSKSSRLIQAATERYRQVLIQAPSNKTKLGNYLFLHNGLERLKSLPQVEDVKINVKPIGVRLEIKTKGNKKESEYPIVLHLTWKGDASQPIVGVWTADGSVISNNFEPEVVLGVLNVGDDRRLSNYLKGLHLKANEYINAAFQDDDDDEDFFGNSKGIRATDADRIGSNVDDDDDDDDDIDVNEQQPQGQQKTNKVDKYSPQSNYKYGKPTYNVGGGEQQQQAQPTTSGVNYGKQEVTQQQTKFNTKMQQVPIGKYQQGQATAKAKKELTPEQRARYNANRRAKRAAARQAKADAVQATNKAPNKRKKLS